MTLFNFSTGSDLSDQGTNASISFTDNSTNFTLSTSANPSGAANHNVAFYNPDDGPSVGLLSVTDYGGAGVWTLDVTNPGSSFGGSLTLNIGRSITGSWRFTFVGTNGNFVSTVNAANDSITINQAGTNTFTAIKFTLLSGDGYIQIDSLNADIVCYLEDTGIETTRGRVLVQDLKPGDTLPLAHGGETTVKWVGIQPIDGRTAHPGKVNPICITAGAISENVPSRDLYVSPDHAVEIDGLLFNASALVNGSSIYKVATMPVEGFTYYHIETDAHELILAEGLASESYLDNPDRSAFVNGAERAGAPMIPEMALPRIIAPRMVPQDIETRLAQRAPRVAA
ncbi:Hint domain-containing protein [Tropicibacter sp. S64]|uniref:Hint domain-containing protein n=1 Tax=Tropicibacter sp. S64 TaxID=3415122 RepID=UPI003C7DC7DE